MTTDPAPVFDFEAFLMTDDFASMYNENKRRTIIGRISGSISTIASICMIVHILRSHHSLSTTYHRLVFGLAIGDILFSFLGFVLGNIMAPKEYGYIASGAMGNQASCDAQGFFVTFGAAIMLSYNSSICIYYLAIVTFNKNDNYIQTKIEPWLHGISILIPLAACFAGLTLHGYNSDGNNCWFAPNNLPHCEGLESGEIRDGFTIPCDRGDGKVFRFLYVLTMSGILLTPTVIVVTMALMYHSVYKNEKKMQKYGTASLFRKKSAKSYLEKNTNGRASTRKATNPSDYPPAPPDDDDSENDSRFSFIQWLKTNYRKIPCVDTSCCCSSERNKPRPTSIASQKRAILHRAIGYVTAWSLSWIPLILVKLIGLKPGIVMILIFDIFLPLQGVFNLIAYMLPKIRNAKTGPTKRRSFAQYRGEGNGNQHVNTITWRQAFLKACKSRGPKNTSGQHHAQTNGSSTNGCRKSNILNTLMKLRTSITSFSIRQPMNKNSNDGVVSINQLQEIRPPAQGSGQEGKDIISTVDAPHLERPDNNDYYESPAPTLERNIYGRSQPLFLSKDADDSKEEGEGDCEEHQLNNINDAESMNNEDMGEVLDDVFLSEEISKCLNKFSSSLGPDQV